MCLSAALRRTTMDARKPHKSKAHERLFALHFGLHRAMNRQATNRRRERMDRMNNAEANALENTATVAEQGAHGAPVGARKGKRASQRKGAPKAKRAAKRGTSGKPGKSSKRAVTPESKRNTPRAQSKGAKILEMIGRAT